MHPGQRNNLDALCKRYSIDNSHRELHGALLDARILADVYLAMTGGQVGLALERGAGGERSRGRAGAGAGAARRAAGRGQRFSRRAETSRCACSPSSAKASKGNASGRRWSRARRHKWRNRLQVPDLSIDGALTVAYRWLANPSRTGMPDPSVLPRRGWPRRAPTIAICLQREP